MPSTPLPQPPRKDHRRRLVTDWARYTSVMFVWTNRGSDRRRFRFYWWPLVFSLVASVVLTVVLNMVF